MATEAGEPTYPAAGVMPIKPVMHPEQRDTADQRREKHQSMSNQVIPLKEVGEPSVFGSRCVDVGSRP